MGHYIASFAIYTMAMIGLICFALFVYKKFSITSFNSKRKGLLNVEDALGLSPRKTLFIINLSQKDTNKVSEQTINTKKIILF